jgi:hypothetical protein
MITGPIAGQPILDTGPNHPFSTVTISDPDIGQTETVTVTLSNTTNGTLSDPNAASDGSTIENGIYSVVGTAVSVTADLDGLVFTPTQFQVPPGQTVTTIFTIIDTDTAGETATDSATTVIVTAAPVPPPIITVTGPSPEYVAPGTPV